nr:SUMF1/EgtB/PvdO family nonheme iron enzyme [Lentisphaeria bacterium]
AEENCPEEWGRANEQVEEAREAVENAMKAEDNNMAATYYATAMGKWDECKQTLGELESQCNVLKDKNDRIIEELKVARQSFEQLDIKDFISDEWEAFLKEYDSKSNLEKSFDSLRKRDYYKRSIEICEYLGGKLDLMKFNAIPQVKSLLESADKDAHAAQSKARENLAQLEFPDETNNLGERMAKQDDEMEKWNQQFQGLQPSDVQNKSINELLTNYKTIKNAYDEIKQDYEDIDRKTTEQRKELDAVYASLKKTYNNLFNDKEIRTVVKTEELDALQQRLTEIDESKNKRNAAGLIIDIQKLNSDCVEQQKKGNINKQLLRQAEISYKAWMDNKALLEKFQEQWKPETNALMKEGKQAEEKYKELCRDFEFEKARELADGWLKKFDEASQELSEVIQKKAGELKEEALKMIEELKTVVTPDDDHVDITFYNESYKNGLEAWGNKDYLQAYKLFANIKEKLPALIHQLKTAHYAKDCEALKTKKDWSGLGKCAREWLDYDPDSQEAKDFKKMSHDMITQQHRDKCVECWNRKDAIGLKICAEQWLEFDPGSQDAQDFLKTAEEITVTIRQFNETCEKYQKQKDVDSLRKCVKQWLEYDPDSQAAQDFLAKADEIEKTIQQFREDCMAYQERKDAAKLEETAKKWLDYKPDSQEAQDFKKMSHDMITQQHKDKCVECWNRKDAIGLKICAEQWLEFDPDSQDAQDFLKKAEEITVTIQQFNETCEKYQKQKDVDSLRKCVKQWLEYDPASREAQDFMAKADEIEKTIQQFRDDCMDCQKRKDAAKLEETANKWLDYKPDNQEAQDFLKKADEIKATIRQFNETCQKYMNLKDVVQLKATVEQWLEYDSDSQEAQDFMAKADEIEKTIQQFRDNCMDCQKRKDAAKLEETAKKWQNYDPNSKEAKDFQKISHDMITQQHKDKCVECWNRKDAIDLKICAEQWLEFDPGSQDAQDFLKKAEEITVTIRQFNETCEKYQKQKDVDSLRKCVEQWLKYDPDSQEAQDFMVKADEIEKTIQQFRDDCMDCQKRKDAAKLEETANKWLDYKSDSQEARDFLKISHDMTIQQFREKCVACQKQKDAVNLKKIAEEWLKFDQESQEAQDFLKVSHDMTIEAYKEKCLAYKNQEEWSQLNNCAEEWLQFEGDSREAVQYRDLAQRELKNQQYISDFKEANNEGDLKVMENLLRNWRQVAAEKPMFKKADSLYKALDKLSKSVTARKWKEAFALSLEILQGDGFPELGKDCGFARKSLDTSIEEILSGAEKAAEQSAEHPYREQFDVWNRLESEADDILKKLPANPEAVKYREIAQNGKTTLRQNVVDDCRIAFRDEKSYDTLQAKIKSNLSFLEEKYKKDDAIGRLSEIQTQCEKLQKSLRELVGKKEEEITDKLIDDVMKGADGILEMTKESLGSQTCAFADECKRIARSKQRKRIINLPNGQELVLLPVRGANGVVLFWMGECEVSREQYASLFESDTQNNLLKNSWFKVSSKNMKTFINGMKIPTNEPDDGNLPIRSVTWDEAFAWCEMLNVYIGMNRGQFKERDNVLRLPTVGEWQMACGPVVPLTNDVLHQIRTTAPNKQGFYDMLGNVSEWTIDAMVSDKYLYAPPQGFTQQSNIARLPRIHIGRSWQQNAKPSESYMFTANAKFIAVKKLPGAEVKQKTIIPISGYSSPEIGFRVIWAKPLPSK